MKKQILTAVAIVALAFSAYAYEIPVNQYQVSIADDKVAVQFLGEEKQRVKIEILDNAKNLIYTDQITGDKFMRPYNLSLLADGTYYVRITDASGITTKEVYKGKRTFIPEEMQYALIKNLSDKKIAVITGSGKHDTFSIIIKNDKGEVVYQTLKYVFDDDGTIYNLKNLEVENFTFEIKNSLGNEVKTLFIN